MSAQPVRPKNPIKVTIGQLWSLFRELPLPALVGFVGAVGTAIASIFYAGWAVQAVYTEQQRNAAFKERDAAARANDELSKTNASLTLQVQTLEEALGRGPIPTDNRLKAAVGILGIDAIWPPEYAEEENERIRSFIDSSKTIKIVAYTGEEFVRQFEPQLRSFIFRTGTKIEILLADPTDAFYINNTRMTRPAVDITPAALDAFKQNQRQAITRLLDLRPAPGQLEVKMYTNQMRLPCIIFDDTCVLTLRLPSSERQTVRIEFRNTPSGFFKQCSEYFNAMWKASAPISLTTLDKE